MKFPGVICWFLCLGTHISIHYPQPLIDPLPAFGTRIQTVITTIAAIIDPTRHHHYHLHSTQLFPSRGGFLLILPGFAVAELRRMR